MYTKEDLQTASGIIRQVARNNHISETEVREEMAEAIRTARSNPDPGVRAMWASFQFSGEEPTVEEFILWSGDLIRKGWMPER